MSRLKNKMSDLSSVLLQRGKTAPATLAETAAVMSLPVSEMPMVLTLDELRPNPDNPRTSRNPRFDDIKASIRARGLDTVPKVTRDPEGEPVYIFSDGGNTRYEILCELWQETGDERFYRVPCLFKPWPGRLACVIGHLAENEVRGDLSFIEKAFGIRRARAIYEEQLGKNVTLRELSALLTDAGYPVHNSNISRMEDTIQYLYPCMPVLLASGLGRPQIQLLLALRNHAEKNWQVFEKDIPVECSFDDVFGAVCRHFDDPDVYAIEMFRDELIGALMKALPHPSLNYDRWLLELDPKEQNRRKHFGEPRLIATPVNDAEYPEIIPQLSDVRARAVPSSTVTVPDGAAALVTPATDLSDISEPAEITSDAVSALAPSPLPSAGLRTELQPDMYGAPPVLSGDTDDDSDGNAASSAAGIFSLPEAVVPDSDVAFAAVGLEPVYTLWSVPVLQDDIEHLQMMAFRLAFELAEAAGCEAEIRADRESQRTSGFALAELQLAAERTGQPSPFAVLLLSLTGESRAGSGGCSLSEVLIGSDIPADRPLLDDIQAVKFLRLVRVLRRLRELQRDLNPTEENAE
ncbi:ParB family protein [Cedecea sp.]|uniref:ParB family protein n=1 Tax=Cedecea sp. TaxID=1970739 RepID=UPI002F403B79